MKSAEDMIVALDKAIETGIRVDMGRDMSAWDCESDDIVHWFHDDYDQDGLPAISTDWAQFTPKGQVKVYAFGRNSGYVSLAEAKRFVRLEIKAAARGLR